MEERGREISVSSTERTIPVDPDRTLAAPRFDEKSIQKARPAVPLSRGGKARRTWPTSVVVLCILAALAGGVLGGLVLTLSQREEARVESSHAPQAQATEGAAPVVENAPAAPSSELHALEEETVAQDAPRGANMGADAVSAEAKNVDVNRSDAKAADEKIADAKVADAGTEGELRSALGEWLAATNARDVRRQMQFYAPTMNAFYLSRNTPREAVRAEKSRVFAGADTVDVRASSAPEIRLSRDGQTAVMRFRKRYQIKGGVGARSGEVLQELRWRRTPSGWQIVSERDLRVIQ